MKHSSSSRTKLKRRIISAISSLPNDTTYNRSSETTPGDIASFVSWRFRQCQGKFFQGIYFHLSKHAFKPYDRRDLLHRFK